jgi:CPA2 family monovalent cation:H+ antiporter-2
MNDILYLRDLVVIFAVAVVVVTALHRFRIPSIAGFILAGVLMGPQGLGLINDLHQVEVLAETGVALLLFGIGLEISLERLRRLWWPVVAGGTLQVGLSASATFVVARLLGYSPNLALFLGFIIAISSTAIVLQGLEARGELDAPHGRLTLGILVFQDLCVVPMMLAIPLLSGSGPSTQNLFGALLQTVAILSGVLLAARLVVPRALRLIAKTRQRNLFVVTVLLVSLGTAWVLSISGISLALGAFLAGLVVAGSEYRHQALADLLSFRDTFTSIFFVSLGMLLDPGAIFKNIIPILVLLMAVLVGKSALVFVTAMLMRLPLRVCVLAAAALSQIGEFSFVLMHGAQAAGLLTETVAGNLVVVAVLSMLVTPFGLSLGPHLAAGVGKIQVLTRLLKVSTAEDAAEEVRTMHDHVIIGGYGLAGQELAQALRQCGIPYVIAELSVENVRRAVSKGEPAYFCDVTSFEVLQCLKATSARELVLVINDPDANLRAVKTARSLAPNLHIVVRTSYQLDIEPLLEAGANEIISAEIEAAAEVVSRTLTRHKVDPKQLAAYLSRIRSLRQEKVTSAGGEEDTGG